MAFSRSFGLKMGTTFTHFVLKLGLILHSGLNLKVPHDRINRNAPGTVHRAMIINCKLGYHKYYITLHIRKRLGLEINKKHSVEFLVIQINLNSTKVNISDRSKRLLLELSLRSNILLF